MYILIVASEGNYFAAFKVPLDDRFSEKVPETKRWTPEMVRENFPNLGMVIDLTKASPGRFYDENMAFSTHNISYAKHACEGTGTCSPPPSLFIPSSSSSILSSI